MSKETVFILDFGSPYTQLIAQRVRDNHVFSQVVPYNISAKEVKLQKPKGIILSGGPITSVTKKKKGPSIDKAIFRLKIPILGIGYSGRLIVQAFGGRVKYNNISEFQRCELFIDDTSNLFWKMPNNITCWISNQHEIKKPPRAFRRTAHTQNNPIAAVECPGKKIFAVAFHPEVVATQRGSQILNNFLYRICKCIGTWIMDSFIKETTVNTKKAIGTKAKAILNLKTTTDSLVTAVLFHRILKARLKCIFIDNGLLRKDEARQMRKVLNRNFNIHLHYRDRTQRFLHSLKGITNPEQKKSIVKELSSKIFREEAKKVRGAKFLVQDTIHSTDNKSGSKGNPLKLKVLEPLKDLFKDEVRIVAKELGLPDNLIFKQPYPESGLAIRIIGEATASRLKILREAEVHLVDELKTAGIYDELWQSFAILLPEENIIAIRCIASIDGMTADWVRLPYPIIDRIAKRIINKIKGIDRVVYDVSSRPPATIEWE